MRSAIVTVLDVGQTSGLPVKGASGPEVRRRKRHGAGGSLNRQAGGQ